MTSPSPDPDPSDTPGLEPGGGVRPGDTPPSEAGTSGLSDNKPTDQKQPSGAVNKAVPIAIIGLVLLFVLFFVVRAIFFPG
ncbi:DUF6480 family protein [Pseudokineococcus lusitanus]|uniref:Uncharacterized protein n=1 Tax=Pseudokineococcus lusitanus TaxID=763993 RepID=A0A3N1HU04_9ACTN|nr:DUF6480 family protein [Pseudokineococcus lusitanus]ROP46013.1 hypothetical protein EDC03_0632 [Pseudokineococcus lusitanus]